MPRSLSSLLLLLALGVALWPVGCAGESENLRIVAARRERDAQRRAERSSTEDADAWRPPTDEEDPQDLGEAPELTFERLRAGDLNGRILHGSRPLFSPADHDDYLAAFPDTKSILVGTDTNLGGSSRFTPEKKLAILQEGFDAYPNEFPVLSILYTRNVAPNVGRGLGRKILNGRFDSELETLAGIIKGFGRPAFVRIASEFNGEWSGYSIETFAESFRYIVDFFRERDVDNAIWVWNYMPQARSFPFMDWYPGDDYVDWWSVDVFAAHFTAPKIYAEMQRYLTEARLHGKPVIIAESAPSTLDVNDPATWSQWFAPYFSLINSDKNIKAFVYSNVHLGHTTTELGWKDVRLPGSAMAEPYYRELSKPQYVNQPR